MGDLGIMDRQSSVTALLNAGYDRESAERICDVLKIELGACLLAPADWPADYRQEFKTRWRAVLGFWKGEATAFRALDKAMKAGTAWRNIIAGIDRYALSRSVRSGYIQYPGTWLNAMGWKDEEPTKPTKADSPSFFEIGFTPR